MRPYLRVANVHEAELRLDDVMEMHFDAADIARFELRSGDILLNEGQSRELVGRPAMYQGELPGACFTNSLIRFQAFDNVDPRFAFQLFRHWMRHGDFQANAQVTTNIAHLGAGRFAEMDFPLPPLSEQRRIVAKLEDLLDRGRRAKAALDAIPRLLEQLRQSVLAAAFRGDLTADWREKNPGVEPAEKVLARIRAERRKKWEEAELAKMKAKGKLPADDRWRAKYAEPAPVEASGLPDLPPGWCWASLDELVVRIEAGASPKAHGRPAGPGERGVLKVSAVTWEEFDASENKALFEGEEIGETPTVRAGDLLISRANTVQLVGAIVLVDRDHANLMLSDKTLRLVPASAAFPVELLLYGLRSREVRAVFEDDATGTSDSMRNLSQVKLRAAPIPLPPSAEAKVLVDSVAKAMRARRSIDRQSVEVAWNLQSLERAILARAFRGELVAQDPNDEPADVMLARLKEGIGLASNGASPERCDR
jgi:type I restriction enzyme S subunit